MIINSSEDLCKFKATIIVDGEEFDDIIYAEDAVTASQILRRDWTKPTYHSTSYMLLRMRLIE